MKSTIRFTSKYIVIIKALNCYNHSSTIKIGYNDILTAKSCAQKFLVDIEGAYSVEILDNNTGELLFFDTLNESKVLDLNRAS